MTSCTSRPTVCGIHMFGGEFTACMRREEGFARLIAGTNKIALDAGTFLM